MFLYEGGAKPKKLTSALQSIYLDMNEMVGCGGFFAKLNEKKTGVVTTLGKRRVFDLDGDARPELMRWCQGEEPLFELHDGAISMFR